MKKLTSYILLLLLTIPSTLVYAQELSLFGDYLYWKASQQTSSIWTNTFVGPTNNKVVSTENVNLNWTNGLRAGFIYKPNDNLFDARLYWTSYITSKQITLPVADQIILSGFFSGFLSNNFFFGAGINWQMNMNTLDAEISRAFQIAKTLTLRPAIGVKAAVIDQTIHVDWNAVLYNASERLENNYSGIGPTLGLNGKWNVFHSVNVIANFSAAYLWGKWHLNDVYTRPNVPFIVTPTTITTRLNPTAMGTLMLDYFLGLEWLYKGRSQVRFQLGYEMQYWANQLRLLTFQQLPTRGDLTLQGVTCGICIDL